MKKIESKHSSDDLYEKLCMSANSLRRENAKNIKSICDNMEKDKVEITLRGVAKRCLDSFGSPAISTVTNTGSELGEYIRLRRQQQNIKTGETIQKTGVSSKVQDPVLAQEVKILEETVKGLKNQNNALRVLIKKVGVDIDSEISRNLFSSTNQESIAQNNINKKNNPHLKSAIASLLTHLSERGYTLFRGRYSINKRTVLTPMELDALKEVIDISESEFNARYLK